MEFGRLFMSAPTKLLVILLVLFGLAAETNSFQQHRTASANNRRSSRSEQEQLATKHRIFDRDDQASSKPKCDPCQRILKDSDEAKEDDDIAMEDRREAAFAMLGSLWAVTSFLPTFLLFPEAAQAAYGQDAKIVLPNPIDTMIERASKQCLVETLGNRECLVWEGDENKLYQGADGRLLLERVEKALSSLANIPALIEQKKWSQVNGILTGPLGDLVRTMNQLAALSATEDGAAAAKQKVNTVKNDLYGVAASIEKKLGDKALQYHQAATNDLVAFIKSL